MREPELVKQITCRAGGEKCAARFGEIGSPVPASCLKASGIRGPTPARSRGSATDLADSGLTNRLWSRAPGYESIPGGSSTENAVPFPQQTAWLKDSLGATLCRSSLFWLRLSSARPKRGRSRSRLVAGIRQNSFVG